MYVNEGGPFSGACWREGVMSGYGLGGSGCGEGFELEWASDADLGGVLGPGWKGNALTWPARGVIVSSKVC